MTREFSISGIQPLHILFPFVEAIRTLLRQHDAEPLAESRIGGSGGLSRRLESTDSMGSHDRAGRDTRSEFQPKPTNKIEALGRTSSKAMPSTLIGNPAPPFDLPCTRFPDPSRNRAALEDYRGRWLLLLFYPRDFSLVCPTELIGLSQRFEEFEQQQCDILGVSCDPVDLHERWMATPVSRGGLGGLNFPLASDVDGAVSQAYGVYQAAAACRRAGPVHHRSRGTGPIPGRARPERRPAEPGSLAGAHRPPVGRTLPRGLDARPVAHRPVLLACGPGISSRTT